MTNEERKVIELALEALGTMDVFNPNRMEAITALRQANAEAEKQDNFCDNNCVWTDHHPDCKLGKPNRQELQAKGEHPAPCARFCEANAFRIAERGYQRQIKDLQAKLAQPEDKKCENCGEFGECCQDAQPEQDPENRCVRELREFAKSNQGAYIFPSWDGHRVLKYLGNTTLPQRKPLTDEDIFDNLNSVFGDPKHHKIPLTRGQIIDFGRKMFDLGTRPCTTPPQRTEQEQQIETLKRCLFQMQETAKDLVEQAKSLPPPQRTWVGLDLEEQSAMWDRAEKRQAYQGVPALAALIQEVEAKLKEKNA